MCRPCIRALRVARGCVWDRGAVWGTLHEPEGKGASSGPCWGQAPFFSSKWVGEALGWEGAGWRGQS